MGAFGSAAIPVTALLARLRHTGSLWAIANRLTISAELAAVVERARRAAGDAGELRSSPAASPSSPLSPEARAALAEWRTSGDYDRAVAEIVARDPDLATQ